MISTDMDRWRELGQKSSDTVLRGLGSAQAPLGLPLLHRSLVQVAEQTKTLVQGDGHDSDAAVRATRLLASQGLDLPKIRSHLAHLQVAQQAASLGPDLLRPAALAATPGVDPASFSAALADACLASACQESQDAAASAFRSLMDVVGAGASTASTSHPSYLPRPSSSRPSGREGAIERGLARSGVTAPLLQADSVEGRYLSAVRTCNEGQLGSRTACEVFAGAALQGMSRDRDVTRMWGMLREMATSMKKGSAGGSNKAVLALASGARRFLEKEHMAFVEKVVQRNRDLAQISGTLGPRSQIKGFLRARLRLPAEQSLGSADLLWQQVYLCMRSGLYQEALEILKENEAMLRAGELMGWLTEWVEGGGVVGDVTSSRLTERCHRLMAASAPMQTRNAHAVLIHVALSGDSDMHDRFLSEYRAFFSNIEDFLWFKLALVRCYRRTQGSTAFSVEEMQQYLNEFQPRHYSKDGKQPLLYAAVLVLSLQFHAAVDFLVNDPTAMHSHGTDAVHICIAMHQDGLLETAQPVPGVAPEGAMRLRPAAVVHAYASQQFLSRQRGDNHVEAALEYFIAAANVSENPSLARAELLQELVTRTRAYGTLLGGGGRVSGSSLVARLARPEDVESLVGRVAEMCREAAQNEAATELFLAAGRAEEALSLLVRRMSDLVASAPDSEVATLTQTAEFQELIRRGKSACERVGNVGEAAEDFQTLQTVGALLERERRRNWLGAMDALSRLHRYVPARGHTGEADKCVRAAAGSGVVLGHMDDVLGSAARVIEAQVSAALQQGRRNEVVEARVRARAMEEVAASLKLQHACRMLTKLCTQLNNIPS